MAAMSANVGREPTSAMAASGRGQGFGDIVAQLCNTWKAANKWKCKNQQVRVRNGEERMWGGGRQG